MKDEIKEILDYWNLYINEPNNYKLLNVHFDEIKKVLDYITNLQEENESNINRIHELEQEIDSEYIQKENYKSRCENANEYIKKNTHEYKMFNKELGHFSNLTNISIDKNNKVFIDDLLKILNGGDEE